MTLDYIQIRVKIHKLTNAANKKQRQHMYKAIPALAVKIPVTLSKGTLAKLKQGECKGK